MAILSCCESASFIIFVTLATASRAAACTVACTAAAFIDMRPTWWAPKLPGARHDALERPARPFYLLAHSYPIEYIPLGTKVRPPHPPNCLQDLVDQHFTRHSKPRRW